MVMMGFLVLWPVQSQEALRSALLSPKLSRVASRGLMSGEAEKMQGQKMGFERGRGEGEPGTQCLFPSGLAAKSSPWEQRGQE